MDTLEEPTELFMLHSCMRRGLEGQEIEMKELDERKATEEMACFIFGHPVQSRQTKENGVFD